MVLFLCSQLQSHLVQLPELITVISIVFFLFYHENDGYHHRHLMPNNFWAPYDIFIQMLKGCKETKIIGHKNK